MKISRKQSQNRHHRRINQKRHKRNVRYDKSVEQKTNGSGDQFADLWVARPRKHLSSKKRVLVNLTQTLPQRLGRFGRDLSR